MYTCPLWHHKRIIPHLYVVLCHAFGFFISDFTMFECRKKKYSHRGAVLLKGRKLKARREQLNEFPMVKKKKKLLRIAFEFSVRNNKMAIRPEKNEENSFRLAKKYSLYNHRTDTHRHTAAAHHSVRHSPPSLSPPPSSLCTGCRNATSP